MPALEKSYFKKKGTVAPLDFLPEPVVHWLLAFAPIWASFPGFRQSQCSTRRSGPLAPSFCPGLRLFPSF